MHVHILTQCNIESLEGSMKSNVLIFAAVLAAASVSAAPGQSPDQIAGKSAAGPVRAQVTDICRCEHNYTACLASTNEGVVESAIAQCIRMKWALPSARLDEVRSALGSLAASGKTPAIRYKASLAGLVYDSPSIFDSERQGSYVWDEDLFAALSNRAGQALLGCNSGSPR
jgi:hypothetical protein